MERELKQLLKEERQLYIPHIKSVKNKIMAVYTQCEEYDIYLFIRALRCAEFYKNKNKILYVFWLRRATIRGNRLGYSIPTGVLGKQVVLYHRGDIIINPRSYIGDNSKLHGDNCIGNNGITNECPVIGKNVDIGIGAKVIGGVWIADNCRIGANAVVTKSCYEENATLVGIPARVITAKE